MQIKVNEKFESVFAEAAALGREEELFKIVSLLQLLLYSSYQCHVLL